MSLFNKHKNKLQYILETIQSNELTQNNIYDLLNKKFKNVSQDDCTKLLGELDKYLKTELKTENTNSFHVFKLNDEGISFMKLWGYVGIDVRKILIILGSILGVILTVKQLLCN
jgi:hypothetical protein